MPATVELDDETDVDDVLSASVELDDETDVDDIEKIRTVRDVVIDGELTEDLTVGKAKVEELIERYQTLVSEELITSTRLNMEGAKSKEDLREIYKELQDAGKAVEKAEQKERTQELHADINSSDKVDSEPDDHADEIEAELF